MFNKLKIMLFKVILHVRDWFYFNISDLRLFKLCEGAIWISVQCLRDKYFAWTLKINHPSMQIQFKTS